MKKIEEPEKVIFICEGKKCGQFSKQLRKSFKTAVKEAGQKKQFLVGRMSCSDNSKCTPVICLHPANKWMGNVKPDDSGAIIKQYL